MIRSFTDKSKSIKNRTRHKIGYLMLFPSYSIYLLFVLLPVIMTIYYSFTNYDFYKRIDFIGLRNYYSIFKDPFMLIALRNTVIYSIFVVTIQIVFGLILASLLNNKRMTGNKFHRMAIYSPNVTSMVSISMIWLWLYEPSNGMINTVIKSLGLKPQKWLFDPNLALFSIIVTSIWAYIGYNMILYLAGLQSIPKSLYEAAIIDGASSLQQFFKITIPMLAPITFFLVIMASIRSFNVFEQVNVMTQGGPLNATTTIVHQIYQTAFMKFDMGVASALTVLILIFTFVFVILNLKFGNQGHDLDS